MEFKRIAIDTSKAVFTLHGIDHHDKPILRRNLSRPAFEAFAQLPPTEVALEACGGSHRWGRQLTSMGHNARLIPPNMSSHLSNAARTTATTPRRSARPPGARV